MTPVAWILLVPSALALLFWLAVLASTARENRRQVWVVKAATPLPPASRPRVSVIVPARNEERNLRACLDSIRRLDWPDLEVLVMDDRSTDGTGAIAAEAAAADPRVRVLGGTDLPPGWMGKCWALHQAQSHAAGSWLLFLDADVQVHPRALAQAHDYAAKEGAGMFSGYGFLRLESFWEKVVMPVLGGMIVGANPLDEVNDPKHERVVCNGQFILLSREAYDRIGGHEAVKGEIIDDMALAREAKAREIRYRMVFCRELFRTRMYTTFGEIWQGWTKNLYAALGYRPGVALGVVVFILVTAVLPPAVAIGRALALPPAAWAGDLPLLVAAAATVVMLGYRIYASRIFEQPWGLFWTHPLGALVSAGIFLNSARLGFLRRTVAWKGRDYSASGPVDRPSA